MSEEDVSLTDIFERINHFKMRNGPQGPDKSIDYNKKIAIDDDHGLSDEAIRKATIKNLNLEFEQNMQKLREKAGLGSEVAARHDLGEKEQVSASSEELALTNLDAQQLADMAKVIHPLNEDAKPIMHDLDDDLVKLYQNNKDMYTKTIKMGVDALDDFDSRAQDYYQTPVRQIKQLMAKEFDNFADLDNVSDDYQDQIDDPLEK